MNISLTLSAYQKKWKINVLSLFKRKLLWKLIFDDESYKTLTQIWKGFPGMVLASHSMSQTQWLISNFKVLSTRNTFLCYINFFCWHKILFRPTLIHFCWNKITFCAMSNFLFHSICCASPFFYIQFLHYTLSACWSSS